MFGLIKLSFWVCLALLFVPVPHADNSTKSSALIQDMLHISSAAASDMSGFCTRNPDVCVSGERTAGVLLNRVRMGAEQVYHYAMWVGNNAYTPQNAVYTKAHQQPIESQEIKARQISPVKISPSQNTLLPSDLEPSWGGDPQKLASN
jgi:hypothetical protein